MSNPRSTLSPMFSAANTCIPPEWTMSEQAVPRVQRL